MARKKLTRFAIVLFLIFAWLLTGWPVIWPLGQFGVNTIRIPPRIQEVQAADTGFLTFGANAAVAGAGDGNGFETSPTFANTDDTNFTTSANTGTGNATDGCTTFNQSEDDAHNFYNFGFSIPVGATIDGIEATTINKWSTNTGTNQLCLGLSWDAGSSWTSAIASTDIQTAEETDTYGGAANTWGRTWTITELNNTNFRVRIMIDPGGANTTTASLDYLQIKVYYTPDTSVPTPNPMTFTTAPANDSTTQISMTSTTGSDATGPVNYLFTNDNSGCGANAGTGGTSSSWQASTSYSDSGLDTNKCYGYTVTARDSVSPTPNTGTASNISSAYTSANTPGTPTLSGATSTTLNLTNAENSNPSSNPTTNFAVQTVTTSPTDSTWLNQWVNASGNPSATAVWLTDAQLDALVLQGLQPSTTYGVKVKAKNQDNDETPLSAEGQGTTSVATVVSVILTTDGTVSYGILPAGTSKDTTASGLNDTQTAQNNGNVTENFNIKTSNATGGTQWTIGAAPSSDVFVHEFSTNGGGAWTKFTVADSYQALATGIAASGTQNFDLKITVPSSSSDYQQKTITVTVQAVAQ